MKTSIADDIPLLSGPVQLSHSIIRTFVRNGDRVVDATCGNGNDTCLLAELVGPQGTVWAFDIQKTALEETSVRLAALGLEKRVQLVHTGHEFMYEYVVPTVSAVVFNLGYLPGGDRSIITRPDTTLRALDQSLQLLSPGGILAVTVYSGHAGGAHEKSSVFTWAAALPQQAFHSWRMGQVNTPANAPSFILIQKAV